VQAARTLSTRGLTGITLYRPAELVISARAGTPIPEIEAALAEKGQLTVTELIAAERKTTPDEVGYYRLRPPVKPITLAELASLPISEAERKAVER